MKRLAIAVPLLAIVLVLTCVSQASAMSMKDARHAVVGGSIYNHKTHVLTSLSGTYRFQRQIKHKGHWTTRTFFGPKISAQHCYNLGTRSAHCKGRIIGGPVKAFGAPGRAVPSKRASDPPANYCYQVVCTNPFFWTTGIAQGIVNLQQRIVDPCESGGLSGFGGGVVGNLVAKAMLASGAIGETTAIAKFSNPESIAFLSVAGCVGKVAQSGTSKVQTFLTRLQHFGMPNREARHGVR